MTENDRIVVDRHSMSLEISNEMVRLYKELFGRGPSRTHTHFAGPDVVLSSVEGSFTPAERSMVEMGESQRLREARLFFQHARELDFRAAVERVTGRRVVSFTSGTDTETDVSSEVFYLEPAAQATSAAEAVDE
jgi:uncharacterized protein YbcI